MCTWAQAVISGVVAAFPSTLSRWMTCQILLRVSLFVFPHKTEVKACFEHTTVSWGNIAQENSGSKESGIFHNWYFQRQIKGLESSNADMFKVR